MSVFQESVNRRSFLKWSGAVAGTTALVGATTNLGIPAVVAPAQANDCKEDVDKTVWSSCLVNCGSRCPLRLQVKDDRIVRVLPDNTGDDEIGTQQIRACVRGRAIRHRIYNPDRLQKPLRRKAGTKRGEGQWDEISWDEALDYIADNLKRILREYGNEAVYVHYASGTVGGTLTNCYAAAGSPFARLMYILGG
jgi:anaerobic dimethyl sulfoxide reductase subunit A